MLRVRTHRVLGRFYNARRLTSAAIRIRQALSPEGDDCVDPEIRDCLEKLRSDGLCSFRPLSRQSIERIEEFARNASCTLPAFGTERFRFAEIRAGYSPEGNAAPVVDVVDPSACAEIGDLAQRSDLLEVAHRYLGYRPRRICARLFWSSVSAMGDQLRRRSGQTIDFHYDIEACNSFYAYFYITQVTPETGPHVVVLGSHRWKPLSMSCARCFQTDRRIVERYGRENIVIVLGDAGYGFLEDPSCFHKAVAPSQGERLCLQIRYL